MLCAAAVCEANLSYNSCKFKEMLRQQQKKFLNSLILDKIDVLVCFSFLFGSQNIKRHADYQLVASSFSLLTHKKQRFSATCQKKKIKANYNA